MNQQANIESKLGKAFNTKHIEVINESHMHAGPATESHFKVVLVADDFAGLNLVKRHQKVYQLLAQELDSTIHALALHTYTEDEWQAKFATSPQSPNCQGGS